MNKNMPGKYKHKERRGHDFNSQTQLDSRLILYQYKRLFCHNKRHNHN